MGKFTFGEAGALYERDKVDMKQHEGAPKCPRCSQRVYFSEEKKALGKSWHIQCFTCCQCKKTLSSTNYNEFEGELMCTACHRRYAGAAAKTASTSSTPAPTVDRTAPTLTQQQSVSTVNKDDLECCPQCGRRVYFAEEVKALKRKWHRMCFKCVSCRKTLEPSRCTEHQGELYCQPCHGRQFGPLGLASSAASSAAAVTFDYSRGPVTNGATYTDTFVVGATEPIQPIRGAQEWTESIFLDPTPAAPRDRFTS